MSSGAFHRTFAAAVTGTALLSKEAKEGQLTGKPLWGALLSAACTNIPDLLEPATHPHHRQFFHSLVFAGFTAWGLHKVYEWEPETEFDKAIRFCVLVGGASVLMHLILDSATPRSLPIIGKL